MPRIPANTPLDTCDKNNGYREVLEYSHPGITYIVVKLFLILVVIYSVSFRLSNNVPKGKPTHARKGQGQQFFDGCSLRNQMRAATHTRKENRRDNHTIQRWILRQKWNKH